MKYLVINGSDCIDSPYDTLQAAFDDAVEYWGEGDRSDFRFYEVKELSVNMYTTIKEVTTIKEKR